MYSLLDSLLDEAVDSEGLPIPLESVEARFILQNFNHILSQEETVGELTFNKGKVKGWTDEARAKALLKRKRKAKVEDNQSKKAQKEAYAIDLVKKNTLISTEMKKRILNLTKTKPLETAVLKNGTFVLSNGSPLPSHIPRIPPAWKKVRINTDPNAALLVKGIDKKGRTQSVYSSAHHMKKGLLKFAKVNELRRKQGQIISEIHRDMKKPATKEVSIVLALIHHTGIRPGSKKDTGAEKTAYGATTLKAEHVVNGGKRLEFVGKKGVSLSITITDPAITRLLNEATKGKSKKDNLFNVTDSDLRDYTHTKDGGGFNPKDFRTAKGTESAIAAMKGIKAPTSEKEYKALIKEVAVKVSNQLGNTPTIALQSYIDPTVFASWRIK